MKLLRLRLENFRQHRDSEITFRDGMTAIVGVNGSGKTTILEAITFALYGVQRKTKESVKFYWAEARSKMRVTLEFEFDGRTYLLERNGTDAFLIDKTSDPQVTKATGLREVRATCENLLRLTYDQFKNSFCAEQKSLTFLQFNTDTRRQEQVAKMLGFDRLKAAADLAKERGRIFRGIADQLAMTMGNIEELRKDRETARADLKAKKEMLKQAEERVKGLMKLLPAAEERKGFADEYVRLTQEASVFFSNAEVLKSAKKRAEESLAKATADALLYKEVLPIEEEFRKLDQAVGEMLALRELELDREKLQAEATRVEVEIKELNSQIERLKPTDVAAARAEVKARSAAYAAAGIGLKEAEAAWSKAKLTAQASLSTAESEEKQARQALAKARDLIEKGICPECGQATSGSFEGKLKCLTIELKAAEAALAGAQKSFANSATKPKAVFDGEDAVASSREAYEKAQESATQAEKLEAEAKSLREQVESKRKYHSSLAAELAKKAAKYDRAAHQTADLRLRELRPKHEQFLRLSGSEEALKAAEKTFDEAKRDIEVAKAQFEALKAECKKLPFSKQEEAVAAISEFEALRRQAADAEVETKRVEVLVSQDEARLERAEERIKTYEQAEASLKESRTQALLHETADKEMKLLREELNSVIRPDLEARASENLSLLTNGRYPILELDEEFNALVIEEGVQKHVISGGEEDVVALALRMALSELIQERQGRPMSLMILDEVFGSLDADRRQAVLERLHAIKGRFAQILVISHIEEINQVADQCIFLTRDEKSRATVIGDLPVEAGELVLT